MAVAAAPDRSSFGGNLEEALSRHAAAGVRSFLGVEKSINGRRWIERLDRPQSLVALDIAQRHELPELLARVLAGRGVTADEAPEFLDPTIRKLMPDPSTLTDMDAAAERIADAVDAGEGVAIFGDYDVDGATSAALLNRYLRSLGLTPQVYIPDRLFEGYGPNPDAIDKLADAGATLIVTVDCGTTSFEALERARQRGIDVVVIDHHLAGAELPPARAVVNPNREDDISGLGHLAAVGIVFMTLVGVSRELRSRGHFGPGEEPNLLDWLDLVALGTVCDVVGLAGLNRALVVKGLLVMRRQGNLGLGVLARLARLGGPIEAGHLGFMIGPRINAGGRIGNAALGAALLATEDPEEAERIGAELERLNAERQTLEAGMLAEAMAAAEPVFAGGAEPAVLVTHNPGWHPGVVGLIASRLKERFGRPAFAVADGPSGFGVGSGRSIPGVDLGRAVKAAVSEGLLAKGGGHAMAAGVTVALNRLRPFQEFIEDRVRNDVKRASAAERDLKIDAAVTAEGATVEAIADLERAGPFGAGNPSPVIAFPAHQVTYAEIVGGAHVRTSIATGAGANLRAMAFRSVDTPIGQRLLDRSGGALHVAGTLSIDTWQGRSRPTIKVIDVAEPTTA